MKYFFLSLFVLSCATAKNPSQLELTIRPGEVRWIEREFSQPAVKLFCRDQLMKTQRQGKKILAVIIESYFSELRPFTCTFKAQDQVLLDIFFKVENREYKAEKLKVEPRHVKLSAPDQARAEREQLVLNKIYASSSPELLFQRPFQQPLSSLVTSSYGTKRVYNKEKVGQHLGIDYRAAIGDKVPCVNAGRVLFAGDLFYTGWTVIIDHGLDMFSVYGHLSKPLVKEGQLVERGEVIGLSGNSGRTSGPHLHWGMKIQGQYIDGLNLIDESQKVFKE